MKQLFRIGLLACAGISLWGQDAAVYLKQGNAQAKAGQYRQAVASYRQVISMDPGNSQAYSKLGDAYNRLGMPSEAAKAYEKAADLMLGSPAVREVATPAQIAEVRPAPPANPPGTGGSGLNGLYLMTRFWPGSGLEIATYEFRDGTVVKNPIGPARSLDVQAERASHPNDVGTYRLQAGQLVMTFPDGNHPAKFEPESKGCFGWDAGIFCPVETFKAGTTLDGTFSGGASAGGGAVMSSTTVTFRRDGTYERESVGSISSQGRLTAVTAGSVGRERGRYSINGAALHMMPDGGKETVVSTFPYDDGTTGPAPRSIYFGGGMLKHVK